MVLTEETLQSFCNNLRVKITISPNSFKNPPLARNPPLVHLGHISESGRSRIWGILVPDFGRFSGLKRPNTYISHTFWWFYKVKYQNFRLRRFNNRILPCVARRRREKIAFLESLKCDFTRENGPKNVDFRANSLRLARNPPLLHHRFWHKGGVS